MSTKKYTYHKQHSFITPEGNKISMNSELYQVGVYCIINGDPAMQSCLTPRDMQQIEKRLQKEQSKGQINNLKFASPVTVVEENGLWVQVKATTNK